MDYQLLREKPEYCYFCNKELTVPERVIHWQKPDPIICWECNQDLKSDLDKKLKNKLLEFLSN